MAMLAIRPSARRPETRHAACRMRPGWRLDGRRRGEGLTTPGDRRMPDPIMSTPGATTPAADSLDALAEDLDALSNLQRLRLLHLLTRPRYAEEIADALGMSRQSALKHIEKLSERGFVRPLHGRRSTGPVIEFLVVPQRLFAVGVAIGNLGNLEPEGGPQMRVEEQTVVLDKAPT